MKSLYLLIISILLTGCGAVTPQVKGNYFGDLDLKKNENIFEETKKVQEDPTDVKVISGIVPQGLELTEQGSKLVIQPGFENKYKVIGSLDSDYYVFGIRDTLWTREYYREKDSWRKVYCGVQAPFKAVTLGIWAYLVPFAWPCNLKTPSDENERKATMISEMKRAAKVMGGNLLIVNGFGSLQITSVQGGRTVGTSITPSTSSSAFVVKEN